MTRIAVTSDWHGYLPSEYPSEIPTCDLMLVAGDIGLGENFSKFNPELLLSDLWKWIENQPMPIVAVAGNHDFNEDILRSLPWHYLQDEMIEIEGLKIWGSPWSNPFGYGWAFNMPEEDQVELYAQIPDDIDIIINHGPPFEYCDLTLGFNLEPPKHVGSKALRNRMEKLDNLKLVACGHIHCSYGKENLVINGSLVGEDYKIKNKPYIVEI